MRSTQDRAAAFTLIELMVSTGIMGVAGVAILSMLMSGMILGAKNSAVNNAHQQARTAMQQIISDLHSSVSLPFLIDNPNNVDANGKPVPAAGSPAAGIAFQMYSMGPLRVSADTATTSNLVTVTAPLGMTQVPQVDQRLIVVTHKVEDRITAVVTVNTATASSKGVYRLTLKNNVANKLEGASNNIACFITDRCSYTIIDQALFWQGPGARTKIAVLGNVITNATPFSTPQTDAGAYDFKFIAAIDLSTSDSKYTNRGFKSANILLNGKVPTRARLTTYQ